MSLRELPDFLKQGDPELPFGRPRYPGMQIGKGFTEARPVTERWVAIRRAMRNGRCGSGLGGLVKISALSP